MNIQAEHVVSFHYTLTDDDGKTLDSSEGKDPLTYMHGRGQIIPGLEDELTGKEAGDTFKATVKPKDGYGDVNPDLIQKVAHKVFDQIENLEPGMQLNAKTVDGQNQVITVMEIDEQGVVVDGNHPLAGRTLHFDVTVSDVREATDEERSHGHAH